MSKQNGKNGSGGAKQGDRLQVGVLIDESGSMTGTEPAVIGGFNELVGKLAADEAKTKVLATLAMFDLHGTAKPVRFKFAGIPLDEVRPLEPGDYLPRGATPLNDAVAKLIGKIGKHARKSDRVMVVILTDGFENASETSTAAVRKLILERERAGWEFVYLGANHDVWAESQKLGLAKPGKARSFTASDAGTRAAMAATADHVRLYRDAPADYDRAVKEMPDEIDEDPE